jgi:hypothetical protein
MPQSRFQHFVITAQVLKGGVETARVTVNDTDLEHKVTVDNYGQVGYDVGIRSEFKSNYAKHLKFRIMPPGHWDGQFQIGKGGMDADRMGLKVRKAGPATVDVRCVTMAVARRGQPLGAPQPINSPLTVPVKIDP